MQQQQAVNMHGHINRPQLPEKMVAHYQQHMAAAAANGHLESGGMHPGMYGQFQQQSNPNGPAANAMSHVYQHQQSNGMVTRSANMAAQLQENINTHQHHSYNSSITSGNISVTAGVTASASGASTTSVHHSDASLPSTSVAQSDNNATNPSPASSPSLTAAAPPAPKPRSKIVIKDADNKEVDVKAIASTNTDPRGGMISKKKLGARNSRWLTHNHELS